MLPIYETDRLILRPQGEQDLENCLAMDLDPEVVKYIRPIEDEESHRAHLNERFQITYAPGLGVWSVFTKDLEGQAQSYMGWVLLIPLAFEGPEIEIGYRLVRRAWGKGIASEAAACIRDHAFTQTDLQHIIAVTHPDNKASQNVLRKIGLEQGPDKWAYGEMLPYFCLSRERWKDL